MKKVIFMMVFTLLLTSFSFAEVGRYQIVVDEVYTYRIDTESGQVWFMAKSTDTNKKYWEFIFEKSEIIEMIKQKEKK